MILTNLSPDYQFPQVGDAPARATITSAHRLYFASDRQTVVSESDPRAAHLIVGAGGEISAGSVVGLSGPHEGIGDTLAAVQAAATTPEPPETPRPVVVRPSANGPSAAARKKAQKAADERVAAAKAAGASDDDIAEAGKLIFEAD